MKLLWNTHIALSALFLTSVPVFSEDTAILRDSLPPTWEYTSQHSTTLPSDDRWWEGFDDPVLNITYKTW